jgi:hypothetical protein
MVARRRNDRLGSSRPARPRGRDRRPWACGRRRDVPGPPSKSSRRSVRPRNRLRSGAGCGGGRPDPDPGRDPRVRPAPGSRVRWRDPRRVDRLPVVADQRRVAAHEPAPHRLCRWLAARGRPGDGDVPLGRRPPADLLLPPRQLRSRVVGPARGGSPRHRSRVRSTASCWARRRRCTSGWMSAASG